MGTKAFWKSKRFQGGVAAVIGIGFTMVNDGVNPTNVTSMLGALWALYGGIVATEPIGLTDSK